MVCVEHPSYAEDDMVVISPSATALQKRLRRNYSAKYKITNPPRVYLIWLLLDHVEQYKYLWMSIHARNDDFDITR